MTTMEEAFRWAMAAEDSRAEAIRAFGLAVVEFVCPFPPKLCARYAKQSVIHSLHQVALERIKALQPHEEHAEPPQEEGS